MNKFKDIISNILLFQGLEDKNLEQIRQIVVEKNPPKGETIFLEGYEANGFYVVVQGKVKIFKVSMDGKEHILHIFGPGEPFAEVPVFTGKTFPANAEAIIKSRLFFFPRDAFVGLISKNPSLALNMLGVLSNRLREFTVQIENLSLKEVPGRLAAYLLLLSKEQKNKSIVELNVSKSQLASLLGTIPETLSRIFSKMNAAELIEVEARNIKIVDMEGLEDLEESGKI